MIRSIKSWVCVGAPMALSFACGASFPVPTQHMADAESAHRSAVELGADSLLIRSKADSELALALAREQAAYAATQQATDQSNATSVTNTAQGAVK
jgi:hypothetical protein